MDTSNALHQLRAMTSDLSSLHTDALALGATEVAHKAWQAREAVSKAVRALGELDAACKAYDAPAAPVVHRMTGSSTVRCGAPMRQGAAQPVGWDLGDVTTGAGVTCPACLS